MSKKIIEAEDYTFKKDKCIYNVYAIPDILNNDKVYLFMWEEHFLYMYDITPIMKSKIGKTVEEYVMSRIDDWILSYEHIFNIPKKLHTLNQKD